MKNRRYSERLVIAANQNIKEKDYWLNKLSGELVKSSFPYDSPKKVGELPVDSLEFRLPDELYQRVIQLSKGSDHSLHLLLVAVLVLLLDKYSYTASNDIIVCVPIERQPVDREFVNTVLLLRNRLKGNMTVKDLILEVRQTIVEAIENYNYPIEVLYGQLNLPVEVNGEEDSPDPLVGAAILLENIHDKTHLRSVSVNPDIVFSFLRGSDYIRGVVEYRCSMYEKSTIQGITHHLVILMEEALAKVDWQISRIPILSRGEREQILIEFNRSEGSYPQDTIVVNLFVDQVERKPEKIAVASSWQLAIGKEKTTGEMVQLTYRVLNERSDQLAHLLREKGVGPGAIVGILVERSLEMVVGILGILKAGGAYMPIDPDYPRERIDYILKDSNAGILLVAPAAQVKVEVKEDSNDPIEMIDISDELSSSTLTSVCQISSANLAYIIYTSGSTGKPKGVMVNHGSVVNLLFYLNNRYPFEETDTYLLKTSYIFDVSVTELFGWFLGEGGRLAILPPGDEKDPEAIIEIVEGCTVTHINFVPSMFRAFVDILDEESTGALSSLKYIFLAGEALPGEIINKFRELNTEIRLENIYGPTEAAVYASKYSLSHWDGHSSVPIGKPVQNTKLYILDKYDNVLPVGIPGELCIVGDGVARGYLNRPELTAEKFLSITYKSHRTYRTYISKKIYKSGDLARWLPDGNIEFLGRLDHQVKVRGFRIELGEIEAKLLKHEKINEAVVVTRKDDDNNTYLCAYVIPYSIEIEGEMVKEALNIHELRRYLSGELPEYMVPSYFVQLEKMPMTPSGKRDRNALPEPKNGVAGIEIEYAAPGNFEEEKLVEIWAKILKIEKHSISVDANFYELGGYSLLAISMVEIIHKILDVKVPLNHVLKKPTVKQLALYIRGLEKECFAAIEPVEEKEYYVLSSAQKRIYILQQMDLQNSGYNMPFLEVLEGDIDKEKLGKTFKKIIQRHESLRTSFHMVEEAPVQRVHDPGEKEFEIEYFSLEPGAESTLSADIIRSFIRPFDLSNAPLLRVRLIKKKETKYILMVDMHHIISDGQSIRLIVQDFKTLYDGWELPRMRLQYKDYAKWQARVEQRAALESQEKYWLKEFRGEIPVLNLPADFARAAVQRFEGGVIRFELGESETTSLHNLARSHDLTPYMVLLAIYYVLLSKLSGQQDIVVGTPVLGRRHADLENIIGMFVNTLPLRNEAAPGKRFKDFLEEVGERALSAFENQEYPFEDLVEKLAVERNASRNPLFDTMFGLADVIREQESREDYESESESESEYDGLVKTSKFDLTLIGSEQGGKLSFVFEYSTDLFKQEKIERFAAYLKKIIASVLENEDQQISGIDMLSQEDKHRLLVDFSNAEAEYLKFKPINDLLEEQVSRTPRKVAVAAKSNLQVTYRELNDGANKLADIIRTAAGKNNCIGIMFDDNPCLLTALFAVIKSGNWFVPLTSNYPDERIYFVLNDCGIKLLLTDRVNLKKAEAITVQFPSPKDLICICIDIDIEIGISNIVGAPGHKPEQEVRMVQEAVEVPPVHPCYIIYTSGSTGRPKGVLITQENVVPLLLWSRDYYKLGEDTRVLQSLSYWFDMGVFEILSTILFGGTLYQGSRQKVLDLVEYVEHIDRQGINIIHTTPSFFNNVVSLGIKMPGLRIVHLGGEMLTANMVIELSGVVSPDCMICNGYGPTEASVNSSIFALRAWDAAELTTGGLQTIPIGKPSANNIIYILNKFNYMLPVEVAGELCVSGRGVSMGYLNRPELTAEKFIHLTLNTRHLTLYKTGDLARWLADGNIEFLGRIDQQVKIRGFRIEPGEIENRLLEMDRVKKAVVIDRETNGEKYLCAYIVLAERSDSEPTAAAEELKKYLSRRLPGYMVPSHFTLLEKLPLTPTGKTDRKALPEPEAVVGTEYVPPDNEFEEQLVEIWSEVLGVIHRPIGIYDNFFELGGHSLKATILAAKIHKVFDIKVPLIEIFKTPTVRELCQYISGSSKEKYVSIVSAERKEYYALSPTQKRMYRFQQMNPESTELHLLSTAPLAGDININRENLKIIFKELIRRHEGLRTSFEMVDGEPVQRVHDQNQVEVKVKAHSHYSPYATKDIIQNFVRPFDLSQAPLLRVGLIYKEESSGSNQILLVEMHHIISDAMSMNILMNDFRALLGHGRVKRTELPELRIQYKDYAEWHNSEQQKESVKKQELYWLTEFAGDLPVLNLPADYDYDHDFDNEKQLNYSFVGDKVTIDIEKEKIVFLRQLTAQQDIPMFMVLLAIFYVLLSKISGQEDIVVGVPIDCRRNPDLETIIGLFANILALRTQPTKEKTFNLFLKELKKKSAKALNNQEYPFEDLVEKVSKIANSEYNCNPLFKVMYNCLAFQNQQQPEGLTSTDISQGKGMADILLTGVDTGEDLSIIVEYNAKLFKKETIEQMLEGYLQIISALKKTKGNIKLEEIEWESDLLTLERVSLELQFNI